MSTRVLLFFCFVFSAPTWANRDMSFEFPSLHQAVVAGDIAKVRSQLDRGVDVNQLDPNTGQAALHIAAQTDFPKIVSLLLERGAFVNLQSPKSGETALMIAVRYAKLKNIRTLLQVDEVNTHLRSYQGKSAEGLGHRWINQFDRNGKSVAENIEQIFNAYKSKQRQLMTNKVILGVLTDPLMSKAAKTSRVLYLIQTGASLDEQLPISGQNDDGFNALLIATRDGLTEVVSALLAAGADQALVCYQRSATALYAAAERGDVELVKLLLTSPRAKEVINIQLPTNGYSPLHVAVWNGHTDSVQLLIEAGADVTLKSFEGDTPIDLARRYNKENIEALFPHSF